MTRKFGAVSCNLDVSSQGKRAGSFDLVHSDNRHAFSSIRSPLGVISGSGNGDGPNAGPTALVCGGNHGDEYEGQIIVRRLYDSLAEADLRGRLILAPALNMPAVLDASRVSPLDGANLNRSFLGAAGAGPTSDIAGFVSSHLMPMADIAIDLHSGGSTANYLDCAYFCASTNAAHNRQSMELASVMGLANTMVVPLSDTSGDFDTAALDAGCAMLSCELGGGGRISKRALEAGWQGVLRVLVHKGVIHQKAAARLGVVGAKSPTATQFLDLGESASFITADSHGLIEPLARIGAEVSPEQPLARLHELYRLNVAPQEIKAKIGGVLAICQAKAIVAPGDHLLAVCPKLSESRLQALLTAQEAVK